MKPTIARLTLCFLMFPLFVQAETVIIERSTPNYSQTVSKTNNSISGPDERILWRLFHAKKYQELNRQIANLQKLFPGWYPPKDLTDAISGTGKQSKQQTLSAKKFSGKTFSTCPGKAKVLRQAKTLSQEGLIPEGLELYQGLVKRCKNRTDLQSILEQASVYLDDDSFNKVLKIAAPHLPVKYVADIRYRALKNDYLGRNQLSANEQEEFADKILPEAALVKDDEIAVIVAWRYYDLSDYTQSQIWFRRAMNWDEANTDARYGLILSLEQLADYDQALGLIKAFQVPDKKFKEVEGRIYKGKAWDAFAQEKTELARKNLMAARAKMGNDSDLQELVAWLAQKDGRFRDAAKTFEELYQSQPSRKYARAYILNQVKVDRQELVRRSEMESGLMAEELDRYFGQELYYRKQFLASEKIAPGNYPKLHNIDSPSINLGGYARFKLGEDGLSRLDIFRAPLAGFNYTFDGVHNFNFTLSRIQLYTGRPVQCQSDIGSLLPDGSAKALCQGFSNMVFDPSQELKDSVEINFAYRKDGWFSPFIELGSTPIGGVIAPTLTFDIGFVQQIESGYWRLEAFSQPIRQSQLSYAGIKDPYRANANVNFKLTDGDVEWGRVTSTGLKSTLFHRLNDHWSLYGSAEFGWVEGKNVADNTMISISAGFGRNLMLDGFDYFSIGPSINYQHFDKNLSHFTLGHGGYFSPDHYFNVGIGVNFLTEEGQPYIVKGRITAGFQGIREAESPWFPLHEPALGSYNAAHNSGEALDIELTGAWLLTPKIQIGGGGAVRKTNGFEDYTAGLFIRYFFAPRQASFSTDIPNGMFSSMY